MLFYSIPVLHGILDDTYLQHYVLLVQAVWILLSDSISDKQFANCEKLLKKEEKHLARFASSGFGTFAMLSHATGSLVGHENTLR